MEDKIKRISYFPSFTGSSSSRAKASRFSISRTSNTIGPRPRACKRINMDATNCEDSKCKYKSLNACPMVLSDSGCDYETGESTSDNRATSKTRPVVPWDKLPPEVLCRVFSYLSTTEMEFAERTCVSWKDSCNVPSLWKKLELNFDGEDSLQLVTQAIRIISSKCRFLREVVIRIGEPRLLQAVLMGECIKQLLDCLSEKAASCRIQTFTIANLEVFTRNRFLHLSKEMILNSLNGFIRSQRNLQSVKLASCWFNPHTGIKLLRSIKANGLKDKIKHLELRHFFRKRYLTADRALVILNSFRSLQEIGIDVTCLNDNSLHYMSMTGPLQASRPTKKPLRKLHIYFDGAQTPQNGPSRESWTAAQNTCPDGLQVLYHFSTHVPFVRVQPYLLDCIPLTEVAICWTSLRRWPRRSHKDLSLLIEELGTQYATRLKKFSLTTRTYVSPEVENALVGLMSACHGMTEFQVGTRLSKPALETMASLLRQRKERGTWQSWHRHWHRTGTGGVGGDVGRGRGGGGGTFTWVKAKQDGSSTLGWHVRSRGS